MAVAILRQNADLWRIPIAPETGAVAGEPQQVIATTREDSRGRWSPDGKQIAFNSDRTGDMNIWVHSMEERTERQITRGPGGDYQPHWSPDGQRIVFFSSRSGNADIWVAEVGTGAIEQLTQSEALDINPFFSPDGMHIAYQSDHDGRREVWVMEADGSGPRQLTNVGVTGHFLLWSRNAEDVIFRSPAGGESKVMRVPLEGGAPQFYGEVTGGAHMSFDPSRGMIMDVVGHKVVWLSPFGGPSPRKVFESDDPGTRIDYPVWSPDGHWLLFDRVRPEGGDIWLIEGHE